MSWHLVSRHIIPCHVISVNSQSLLELIRPPKIRYWTVVVMPEVSCTAGAYIPHEICPLLCPIVPAT